MTDNSIDLDNGNNERLNDINSQIESKKNNIINLTNELRIIDSNRNNIFSNQMKETILNRHYITNPIHYRFVYNIALLVFGATALLGLAFHEPSNLDAMLSCVFFTKSILNRHKFLVFALMMAFLLLFVA
jgi:hypothetical protein